MLPILLLEEELVMENWKQIQMFSNYWVSATFRNPWGAPDGWMLNYTGLMDEFKFTTQHFLIMKCIV
jgi:hypothetical protein